MSRSYNTTVSEGSNLNKSLEFTARSVQIDNITSSWIWVPGGGRYVPPFQYGVIVPLEGTQQGNLLWQTPVGISVPTAGSATAQVSFMEADLPASNGQPVTIPSQAILCPIVSFTGVFATPPVVKATQFTLGAADHGSVRFSVPPGTTSLTLLSTCTSITAVTATGVQSGVEYIPASTSLVILSGTLTPLTFTFTSAADQQIDFAFGGAGSTGIVELSATTTPQAVSVENNSGLPLFVQEPGVPVQYATQQTLSTAEFATPVVIVPPVSGGGVASQAVPLNVNIAAGAASTLVVGSVGVRPYVLALTLSLQTILTAAQTVIIHMQDTAGGSEFASHVWQGVASDVAYFSFGDGVGLSSGNGIRILNDAGSSVGAVIRGSLCFMQSNF